MIDRLGPWIEAHRVIAGGEDDAFDAGPAPRLEDVVEADDVPFEDHRPLVLARDAAQMDDAVDIGDHALHRRHIGEFGAIDLLSLAGRRQRDAIGEAQDWIDAAQGLAQRAADASARPGNQHSFHLFLQGSQRLYCMSDSFAKSARTGNDFGTRAPSG